MKTASLWFLISGMWLLAGCGFQPIYGEKRTDNFGGSLPTIAIQTPRGHNEQLLKVALINRMYPDGSEPSHADYRLELDVSSVAAPTVILGNATVQRYNVRAEAEYTLVRIVDGRVVLRDKARRMGSYNASREFFANYEAQQDTSQRTIQDLAADIDLRLHAFLLAPPKDYELPPQKAPKPKPAHL